MSSPSNGPDGDSSEEVDGPAAPDDRDRNDHPITAGNDPTATEHPTGEAQAAENAAEEPPG